MENYVATIKETSCDLSPRERIRYKNTTGAIKMDEALNNAERIVIKPIKYVVLDIHNDKAEGNKDYNHYVIVDDNENIYVTGSDSFWKQFKSIWDEMVNETEPWELEIFKVDSKNYKGKQFITCNII